MPVELAIDGFGERRFTGRIERINPSTEPGTRAILVYVSMPQPRRARCAAACSPTGRIALAASAPVADAAGHRRAHRGRADATCGRSRTASSCKRIVVARPPRRRRTARVELKTALPRGRAGAGRALRQPEGRRAGARQGAAAAPMPRRRRRRHDASRRLSASEERPPCGSPASRSGTRSSPRW